LNSFYFSKIYATTDPLEHKGEENPEISQELPNGKKFVVHNIFYNLVKTIGVLIVETWQI